MPQDINSICNYKNLDKQYNFRKSRDEKYSIETENEWNIKGNKINQVTAMYDQNLKILNF